MKTVGITGGIGSGKSTVCRVFSLLGVPVYYADDVARRLTEENTTIRTAVTGLFGKSSYDVNGRLDRSLIASRVFQNETELQQLNAIIHPFVASDFDTWKKKQTSSRYVLREAAILFESGHWKDCDRIILVDAPEEIRIERVRKRDGRTAEEIRKIISRQWPSEKKRTLATDIIDNDNSTLIIPHILTIHRSLTTPEQ